MRQHFPAFNRICHVWDNSSPPLTEFSTSYETTLPCYWRNFPSFIRQRFPWHWQNFLSPPLMNFFFCNLWDNSSPPLTEFSVIYETTHPAIDRIFCHLWDSASLPFKEFYGIQCFHCYMVGATIKHLLKDYWIPRSRHGKCKKICKIAQLSSIKQNINKKMFSNKRLTQEVV